MNHFGSILKKRNHPIAYQSSKFVGFLATIYIRKRRIRLSQKILMKAWAAELKTFCTNVQKIQLTKPSKSRNHQQIRAYTKLFDNVCRIYLTEDI